MQSADLEQTISELSTNTVLAASALLIILVVLSVWAIRKNRKNLKLPLFLMIAFVVGVGTITISAATVYLNLNSATGGPVHWHADIEFWACGNELELRDPQGLLSNKIGTPTLHEHNDKRIHLEGVPVELPHDASLGKFMEVIGGEVGKKTLVVPLNDEGYFENDEEEEDGDGSGAPAPALLDPFIKSGSDGKSAVFVDGQDCGDESSEVQVFVYRFNEDDKTYTQTKLDDPANYAISEYSEVPPGDCVIFEFGPQKERTDKLCQQYGVRDAEKCISFGVPEEDTDICEIREID